MVRPLRRCIKCGKNLSKKKFRFCSGRCKSNYQRVEYYKEHPEKYLILNRRKKIKARLKNIDKKLEKVKMNLERLELVKSNLEKKLMKSEVEKK